MKSLHLLALLLLLTLLSASPLGADESRVRHVLLLNSYHQNMSWVSNLLQGTLDVLRPDENNIIMHIEDMDTKRHFSPQYLETLRNFYARKYTDTTFDLILSTDNNAFDFLRQHRDTLFPGVPVVFTGVNDFSQEKIANHKGYTGISEVSSSRETVETILTLHPETEEIYIINDYLVSGRAWENDIRQDLRGMEDRVKLTYSENLTISELQQVIAGLGEKTVILLGVFYADKQGQYFSYEKVGALLTRNAPVPTYCLVEFNLREGAVGGKILSGKQHGAAMARLGQRILAGEDPDSIPVNIIGDNTYQFDAQALEHHGIDQSLLPEGSILVNKPFSFYEAYKSLVWTIAGAFLALTALLILLCSNIVKRRRSEAALRASEHTFRAVFDQTFEYMSILDTGGTLLKANRATLHFCNRTHDELQARPFWTLPCWKHSAAEQEQIREATKTAATGKTVRLESHCTDRQGAMRIIDISIKPAFGDDGSIAYLIPEGRDITERLAAQTALTEQVRFTNSLLTSLPALVFYKDPQGRYLGCNAAFEEFFGHTAAEIRGKTVHEVWPGEYARYYDSADLEFIHGTEPTQQYEYRVQDKHGEYHDVLFHKAIFLNEDGTPAGLIGSIADVSELKLAQARLLELQSSLQDIIDSMPFMLFEVDRSGKVIRLNLQALTDSGLEMHQAVGRDLTQLLPHLAEGMDDILRATSQRETWKGNKIMRLKDDQMRYEDIIVYPLTAEDRDEAGAVILIDDVSQRVRIEELMVQTEKMMSVGGLAAGMAHEINNPLSGILQGAQNIQRRLSTTLPANISKADELGLDLETMQAYIEQRGIFRMLDGVVGAGERAARIVSNMLNFSRKSSSQQALVSIPDLLDKTVELASSDYCMKKNYDFRKILIQREYEDNLPKVSCIASEIEQVFLNLLRNAAQAMCQDKTGEEPATIILRAYTRGTSVVTEIRDNGPGMDEKTRKRVFEPFFTTKEPGEGTGLGLSVSYFILTQNHNGQFLVKSEPGKGATFTIKLPRPSAE